MTPPDPLPTFSIQHSAFSIHEKPLRRHPRSNRGFAMLLALAMLGLVAMLLIFLAHYFAWELKRTRSTTADAQLNQLLLAGAQDALSKSKSTDLPKAPWTLALPTFLSDPHATPTPPPTPDPPAPPHPSTSQNQTPPGAPPPPPSPAQTDSWNVNVPVGTLLFSWERGRPRRHLFFSPLADHS